MIQGFREKRSLVLVASDSMARGMDMVECRVSCACSPLSRRCGVAVVAVAHRLFFELRCSSCLLVLVNVAPCALV
jgi:hypothetical protein